nr:hypothetical protein [Sicyoidochytrium minutum DNA virus]
MWKRLREELGNSLAEMKSDAYQFHFVRGRYPNFYNDRDEFASLDLPSFRTEQDALRFAVDMAFMITGTATDDRVLESFKAKLPDEWAEHMTKEERVSVANQDDKVTARPFKQEKIFMMGEVSHSVAGEPEKFYLLDDAFLLSLSREDCLQIVHAFNLVADECKEHRIERIDRIGVSILRTFTEEDSTKTEDLLKDYLATIHPSKLAKLLGTN